MPVRTEMKRHGSGCRFLMARHKTLYAGHGALPMKDEIVALVCNQGRRIGWEDEESCLSSGRTCWKLEARKSAQVAQAAPEASGEAPG